MTIERTPMLEVRKQYLAFRCEWGKDPTEVRMHPQVWHELLATMTPSETCMIDFPAEDYVLMGMKVVRDPKMPGIQILVS